MQFYRIFLSLTQNLNAPTQETSNCKFDQKNQYMLISMCCSRKYPYPSHARFFYFNSSTPPEFPVKPHTFPFKIWAFETPTPLEFPLTFHGVGMDIFWNCTIYYSSTGLVVQRVDKGIDCMQSVFLSKFRKGML